MPMGASGTELGIKAVVLIALCSQNALYSLYRRYAQSVLQEQWSVAANLWIGEFMKIAIALYMIAKDPANSKAPAEQQGMAAKVGWIIRSGLPMAVPAGMYLVMNVLSFVALERIDAGTYTVCSQLKIAATAVAFVTMLSKPMAPRKWRAVLLITVGSILISWDNRPVGKGAKAEGSEYAFGLLAVLMQASLAGVSSVYFEKVLKDKQTPGTVWDRNIQLAGYSIVLYIPMLMRDATKNGSPFANLTVNFWIISVLGAAGGILVALSVKHTNSVVKSVALAGAVVATQLLGAVFVESGSLSLVTACGSVVVIVSVWSYSDNGDEPPKYIPLTQTEK